MPYEKDENELGVLWKKTGSHGDYFTGTLEINGEKQAIVVFSNANKKSEKAPDFRILKSRPKPDSSVPF
jgi:uncharacterized protein (DUF736 family)